MSLPGSAVLLPNALGPTLKLAFSQVRLTLVMPAQAGMWSRALPASQLGIFNNPCKCTVLIRCPLSFGWTTPRCAGITCEVTFIPRGV